MTRLKRRIGGRIHEVENFFDRLKLGCKWRFHRFGPTRLRPYRGFGTSGDIYLEGRVLDDPPIHVSEEQTRWENIKETIQRIETDEIPGARVHMSVYGKELVAETDEDGFFAFNFAPDGPLPSDRSWHEVHLELLAPEDRTQDRVTATGHVIVPRPETEFGIISDLDDTVVRTGATDKLKMARVVLLNSGRTRMPFEGVAAFYRALRAGPDGRVVNPIFYLSSSPVNFYGHFEHFMEVRGLPPGPILLKDFGFSRKKLLVSGHQSHKLDHIERVFDRYPDLSFVLIGDSGQEDAEIYREAVRRHGADRIAAVYIRDVNPELRNRRDEAVEEIAAEVREMGAPMALVQNSSEAAEHAAEHGLIDQEGVEEVRADRLDEERRAGPISWWDKMIG